MIANENQHVSQNTTNINVSKAQLDRSQLPSDNSRLQFLSDDLIEMKKQDKLQIPRSKTTAKFEVSAKHGFNNTWGTLNQDSSAQLPSHRS